MKTEEPPASEAPAPERVEAKAFSWSAFVSTYLPALILALGTGIAVPAVPFLAKSFHVQFALATGITTSFLIGSVVGTIPSGWMIDRVGRRRVMLLGPVLTSAMAFLTAAAHTFPELLVYRFFDGCASQMWLMGRLAAISHGAAPNQRGRQVSWMFGMDNTGKFIGPLIGGFVATWWGVRAPFVCYGALALIALIPAFMFTKDTPRAERAAETGGVVNKVSVREIIRTRLVYFGVAFFAALTRGPAQAAVFTIYATFAFHINDKSEIGLLAGAAGFIALPIGFTAGWLMDRYGRKRTMVPGFTGVAVSMVALALSAFWHLSFPIFVAMYLVGMAFQALTGGSVQTIGADVAPAGARGKFLGLWRFTGQGGTVISPIAFAFLAASISYGASFLFVAGAAGVVSFLVARFVPETGGAALRAAAAPKEAPAAKAPQPTAAST